MRFLILLYLLLASPSLAKDSIRALIIDGPKQPRLAGHDGLSPSDSRCDGTLRRDRFDSSSIGISPRFRTGLPAPKTKRITRKRKSNLKLPLLLLERN